MLKDRKSEKWFTLASNKGAEEAKAALAAIEEIEFAESEQNEQKTLPREEKPKNDANGDAKLGRKQSELLFKQQGMHICIHKDTPIMQIF